MQPQRVKTICRSIGPDAHKGGLYGAFQFLARFRFRGGGTAGTQLDVPKCQPEHSAPGRLRVALYGSVCPQPKVLFRDPAVQPVALAAQHGGQLSGQPRLVADGFPALPKKNKSESCALPFRQGIFLFLHKQLL